MVQEEKPLRYFLSGYLAALLFSGVYLCNFGKEYYEEQFCEIILNLGQWFRSRCCKRFLIWSSGSPPVWWSGTIYALLKEAIIMNIHVKLYEIWTSGSGGDVV